MCVSVGTSIHAANLTAATAISARSYYIGSDPLSALTLQRQSLLTDGDNLTAGALTAQSLTVSGGGEGSGVLLGSHVSLSASAATGGLALQVGNAVMLSVSAESVRVGTGSSVIQLSGSVVSEHVLAVSAALTAMDAATATGNITVGAHLRSTGSVRSDTVRLTGDVTAAQLSGGVVTASSLSVSNALTVQSVSTAGALTGNAVCPSSDCHSHSGGDVSVFSLQRASFASGAVTAVQSAQVLSPSAATLTGI